MILGLVKMLMKMKIWIDLELFVAQKWLPEFSEKSDNNKRNNTNSDNSVGGAAEFTDCITTEG